ncbi:hypothetical protein FLX56_04910 [Synechococcus moorigangaii CMS01]|nr:hypothetical protein [Synechococcus moorigangaii CMS01]
MAKQKRKTTGKNAVTLSLTSQAIDRLAEMAQKSGFSRSAFVENLMAGTVAIAAPEAKTNLLVAVETKAENVTEVQVSLAENTSTNGAAVPSSEPNELAEKVAAQAKIIADLEAKLADSSSQLKPPVSRANKPEKATPSAVDQTAKVTALEKQLEAQKNQCQTFTKEIEALQHDLKVTTQKNEALQQQLAEKDQAIAQAQTQNQTLAQDLETQKAAVTQLSEKSTAASQAMQAQLQANLAALKQENAQLQRQLQVATEAQAPLQHKVIQLEQALQASQAQASTQADLQKAYAELKQQYAAQGDRLRTLESQTHQATGVTSIGEFYLNRWRKY